MATTKQSRRTTTARTEAAKGAVQQSIEHLRELSEIEAQSRAGAWKVAQDRMQKNAAGLQRLLQPR
ncbi:hypothetical protein [Piscinibacter sp.]|uniref:hypothetical protein n=1 Tax=Piscinibacter sp. TaxID=1903157 RepID=UPI002B8B3D6E|nr:hypothetical protein [Albitalea sp.]HUG25466.1 hypothetical protein [Albitalea sp.]